MDELLELLGLAKHLSIINLTKVYWQIPLFPSSQEKTLFPIRDHAFWPPWGCYYLPTANNQILNLHHQYIAAYVDHIVIYNPTWEEHLQHLRAVLKP